MIDYFFSNLLGVLPAGVEIRQPRTQHVQGVSWWSAMRVLRFRCEDERTLMVSVIERLPRRLTQPPRLHRHAHKRLQIRSAAGADSRSTKARVADRAVVGDRQSALPLDEEQQLFKRLRGR